MAKVNAKRRKIEDGYFQPGQRVSIDDLPVEILLHIFSFLDNNSKRNILNVSRS